MTKQITLTILLGAAISLTYAQSGRVGIGTSSPEQKLDVAGNAKASDKIIGTRGFVAGGVSSDTATAVFSTDITNKGFYVPRLSTTQKNSLGTSLNVSNKGLLVFDTDSNRTEFWNGTAWKAVGDGVAAPVTADNGLNVNAGNNVRLGGNLVSGTEIDVNNNTLKFTNTGGTTGTGIGISTNAAGASPDANTLLTINPNNNTFRNAISIAMSGMSSTGIGMNITSNSSNARGVLYSNSSGSNGVFFGTGSVLSNTNIVSGYTGYRNGSGLSYGLLGITGTNAAYTGTNNKTWALFAQGRAVISAESSPTSDLGTDLEIRNTSTGANPATVSLRQTTNNTANGSVLANINMGDNNQLTPQAQIQVLRDAASSGATDLPTAITFSTTPDNSASLTERMRISSNGSVKVANLGTGLVKSNSGVLSNGVVAADIPTTNTLSLSGNTITSTVNGVAATSNTVSTVSNTSSANTLKTTVNGVVGSTVNIVNNNTLSLSGTNISSSVNGVSSSVDINPAITAKAWSLTGNSGTTPGTNFLGTSDNKDLVIATNGTERARVLGSGNIGIGVTAPNARLDVKGAGNTNTTYGLGVRNSDDIYSLVVRDDGKVGIGADPNSKLEVYAGALGSNAGDVQEVLRLSATTNSNGSILDVRKIRTSAGSNWTTAGTRIQQKIDVTWMGYMQFNGDGNNYGISFGTGSTTTAPGNVSERMRIDQNGKVGIGTNAPTSTLDVNGKIRGNATVGYGTTGGNTYYNYSTSDSYLSALSATVNVQSGDIVKVDIACNLANSSGGSTTYMRGEKASGASGSWLQTPNWITNTTLGSYWSGGYSTGLWQASADGNATFQGFWHIGSGTGVAVYCNITAIVIGK